MHIIVFIIALIVSFIPKCSQTDATERMKQSQYLTPANSLGGIETTYSFPSQTSHRKISSEERNKLGIPDNLIRLSVGIEHIEDIKEDFEQALSSID